jgi:ABC-type nitrate/sulfonate/bicarbonate transport system ATPase subunit/ABC-type nitrate/sulfonate/bicarbonate transport system permease component
VLLLLAVWSAASLLFGRYIVPTPWEAAAETLRLLGSGHAWRQIAITCLRVSVGFVASLLAGTAIGVLTGLNRDAEAVLRPAILLLQGVPPLLWAIPLILVLGIGHLSPMLVIALICFPLVTITLQEGVRAVPHSLEQMLSLFAPGTRARLRELILPHLRPFFAASLRLGLVLGIKASVTGEYFGANDGIGFQLQAAFQALQARRLFAWGLLLVALIIGANALLSRVEKARRGAARRSAQRLAVSPGAGAPLRAALRGQAPPGGPAAQRGDPVAVGLQGVSFAYPGGPELLAELDLRVEPGEIAVISGDSGTGKTTMLHVLAGLLPASSGQVTRPERLGMVFQDDRFLPWRSNLWNVALPLVYAGRPRPQALSLAGELMAEVGLKGQEHARPDELSGGMKKRLSFARCFARFPDAIFLDEPFTGLDAEARRALWQKFTELLELHRGPVVIVTHFPEEVPQPRKCRFYTLAVQPDKGFAARIQRRDR